MKKKSKLILEMIMLICLVVCYIVAVQYISDNELVNPNPPTGCNTTSGYYCTGYPDNDPCDLPFASVIWSDC